MNIIRFTKKFGKITISNFNMQEICKLFLNISLNFLNHEKEHVYL
jgi:hypothetical protein